MSQDEPAARIMIVEDEGIVASDIEKNLQDLGFEVAGIAASGTAAIELATQNRPDLVLMDIRIQGALDGIQTAEILLRDLNVPAIYLTAHGDKETILRAKKTEPLAFLIKPFKKAELHSALEIALYKHETNRRLRERERWLTTTLKAIADAVISVDLEQRVLLMNPAAESLTGLSADQAVGKKYFELFEWVDHEGQPLAQSPIDLALRDLRAVRYPEIGIKTPGDENLRPIRISAAPVKEAERILGAVMVLEDITEEKRLRQAEKEVEAAKLHSEQAEAAVKQRDEFIAVAAHELRTPLTTLQLKLDGARKKVCEGASRHEFLRRLDSAIQQTMRLGQLVERLLDVSRIVAGRLELRRDRVDLGRLLEDVVDTYEEQAAAAGSNLHLKTSGDATGCWDGLRMRQVVVNLLSNALKFGKGKPIEILVDGDGETVRLSVVDHGIGISAEEVERVFGRFERAVSIRHYGGMGLGLFIARHIVQAHGGRIQASATPSGGTTFVAEIPRDPAQLGSTEFPEESCA